MNHSVSQLVVPKASMPLLVHSLAAIAFVMSAPVLAPQFTGASFAQTDEGHGEGEDGHGEGEGGHGGNGGNGNHGGHGTDAAPVAATATTGADTGLVVMAPVFAVPKTYVRIELGLARGATNDAYWLPPGYPNDPQVFFDLGSDQGGFGGIAVGYAIQDGLRGELAINGFGGTDYNGDWAYTVPETEGPHASVTGSTSSLTVMGNLFYEPFGALGDGGTVVPYIMGGLGMARNSMSDWTRTNPETEETRGYSGAITNDLAYAVGLGVSIKVGETKTKVPVMMEIGYRYFDLGTVQGGTDPLQGNGGAPVQGLTFDKTEQTLSVAVRIPLGDM